MNPQFAFAHLLGSHWLADPRSGRARAGSARRHVVTLPDAVTIRTAGALDQPALRRLASLDSAESVPPGPMLLAEIDHDVRAALSLCDGSVIANPFLRTDHLVQLLRAHARYAPA